jgi:hypothetical protein
VEERDEVLPPKVESEKVTVKEGVSKQVVKEGHGLGPPPRHSSCFGIFLTLHTLYFFFVFDSQFGSNV